MDGRRVTTKRVIGTSSKQQNASGSLLMQIGWKFNVKFFSFRKTETREKIIQEVKFLNVLLVQFQN